MPITTSAKKALRSSGRKRVYNIRRMDALRTGVKAVKKIATVTGGDTASALSLAYKAIDKAAKRGVIKKNAASRKKSRLAKFVQSAVVIVKAPRKASTKTATKAKAPAKPRAKKVAVPKAV